MSTVVRDPVRNACTTCAPLGACLALRGVRGCMPLLHGAQGCATYIRRYLIGHFREPADIPASNFDETAAIFGGGPILTRAVANVVRQFHPELLGVATTCLSETIGDDVPALLKGACAALGADAPPAMQVATPSYAGGHAEGYHRTVRALVDASVRPAERQEGLVALLPGLLSAADLRSLRSLAAECGVRAVLLPDYGDSADGGTWEAWKALPDGPTGLVELARLGGASAAIALGGVLPPDEDGCGRIAGIAGCAAHRLGLPIGVRATDALVDALVAIAGASERPRGQAAARSRLLDAYVDAHKHLANRRVAIYGEVDLVTALAGFCYEVGLVPVVCASGGRNRDLGDRLLALRPAQVEAPRVLPDSDFAGIEAACREHRPDLIMGSSKGYPLGRALGLPLIRLGFPVHDRLDGGRIRLVGYDGALALLDRLTDACIGREQSSSDVGYMNY